MAILPLRRFGCETPIPAHFREVFWGVWPLKCSQLLWRPQKGTSLAGNTRVGIYIVPIVKEMRPGRAPKKAKKGKLCQRDHPHCTTPTTVVMWGGVQDIVNHAKFHQNRFKSFGSLWCQNLPFFYALHYGLHDRLGLPPNMWCSKHYFNKQNNKHCTDEVIQPTDRSCQGQKCKYTRYTRQSMRKIFKPWHCPGAKTHNRAERCLAELQEDDAESIAAVLCPCAGWQLADTGLHSRHRSIKKTTAHCFHF